MNKIMYCNSDGQFISRENPIYEQVRQGFNRAIQEYPVLFSYCKDYKDISESIRFATERNIPIRIRSHGHNYEGYSSGNNVLVIDISEIDDIYIDTKNNTVKVGAGACNAQIYNALGDNGYPFPSGTCPTVGVSGIASGGGWGLSCRKFGLTCDNILEIEIINYKGELLVANEKINCDLFWALRGAGGGNFGVIVSITFTIPPKVDYVTEFIIDYPNIDINNQIKLIDIFQKWISKVDNDINVKMSITNNKDTGISSKIIGISYKDTVKTTELLKPFVDIPKCSINLKYDSFKNAVNNIFTIYTEYEFFKSPGRFVNRIISINEIKDLLSIVNQPRPNGSIYTEIDMYGLGGKVSDVSSEDTAFYYRDSKYILLFQSVFENNTYKCINDEWVNNNYPILNNLTKGAYINFPYSNMTNYKYEYYGENLYNLQCIKHKYDPYNIFTFPQGLGNNKINL